MDWIWKFLNSPVGVSIVSLVVAYALGRLWKAKPEWRKVFEKYRPYFFDAIRAAEKAIPDDTENKSAKRLDEALKYLLGFPFLEDVHEDILLRAIEQAHEIESAKRPPRPDLRHLGSVILLCALLTPLVGCGPSAPESIRHQHIEGVKDIEHFSRNTDLLVHRMLDKLEMVGNEKAEVETELAIEQETVTVLVGGEIDPDAFDDLVKQYETDLEAADTDEERKEVHEAFRKSLKDLPRLATESKRFVPPGVIEEALVEFARLRKENKAAVVAFLDDWRALKGDVSLALARARAVREFLERRGIEPEDIRAFSDGFVSGLEGRTEAE